jgi:signal recognition particle receptor subunit alpha
MFDLRLEQLTGDTQKLELQRDLKNSDLTSASDTPNTASPASTAPATPDRSENSSPASGSQKKTRRGGKSKNKQNSLLAESKKKTATKQLRKWSSAGYAEVESNEVLDYSNTNDSSASLGHSTEDLGDLASYGSATKDGDFMIKELNSLLETQDVTTGSGTTTVSGKAFGFLKNIVGGKTMSAEVLEETLAAMQTHLIKKNVANEVAEHLCKTVEKSLVGSKTKNWTSVETTVREAMTEALRRILTPNTSADLLHEIQAKLWTNKSQSRDAPRPYVISVVGVNGVGKSTNLSKIAFWLLQNKFRVLIAACDTFRSGAVEQLKVHVRRLQELTERLGSGEVQIFDEGYGKDAAVIAQKAIEYGQRHQFDIVLIDTAGRRHNDERLMSSLEKFGKLANPDKIVMVGEALVGTDSVQQAKNFNASFGPNRNLDFFLISKCDTVGDMIGSMVNMTYSTGIPVLFVGIGQTYTDLRTLSVDWAVNLLMS